MKNFKDANPLMIFALALPVLVCKFSALTSIALWVFGFPLIAILMALSQGNIYGFLGAIFWAASPMTLSFVIEVEEKGYSGGHITIVGIIELIALSLVLSMFMDGV